MKEKMRKLSLLVFYKDKKKILDLLQDLGIVHLVTTETTNAKLEDLANEKAKYFKAQEILKNIVGEDTSTIQKKDININLTGIRDEILDLNEKIEKTTTKIEHLKKDRAYLEPWGDFKWENIRKLEENGMVLRFYSSQRKDFVNYDFKGVEHFVINETKTTTYFVVIENGEPQDLPFDLIHLPNKSLSQIEESILQEHTEIEKLRNQILSYNSYKDAFEQQIIHIQDLWDYEIANSSFSTHAEGKILHIQGWFPARIEPAIRKTLDDNNFSYLVEKPNNQDKIPIILRNKQYVKRFEPITKMFQLPNFYEFDLTPVVAVFYPIFFAYCLGDSGYGLVLLTIGLIARRTFLKNAKIAAELIMILGIVAAIFGIIKAGSVFGLSIAEHTHIPIFNWLSNFILIPDDTEVVFNTFNVALMIGLFQIVVGICISISRRIRYLSFIYSLSAFGKLFIVLGTVTLFLGGMQQIDEFVPFLPLATLSVASGIFLVLMFHDPDIPTFKRIGGGLLPVYFIFTGFLGDLLSYIRLFALGVASSILGIVVNDIGNQIMAGGAIYAIAGGILFLILGHSLNLAIAALGSFVHPLRLTFVEFYNNAEFKGGGIEFKPFKRNILQVIKI
jgi:V/A-type H+/Na+-transporting ATPase subunit I